MIVEIDQSRAGGENMNAFYIMKMNGYFKSYYTEQDDSSFTTSIRKAVGFKTIEEAKALIEEKKLEDVQIINQFGQKQ